MARDELHVLIVDDIAADAARCQRELARAGLRLRAMRVSSRSVFEAALETFAPDLIISEFSLPPGFDGLNALALARTKLPHTPFIFISDTIGEDQIAEATKRGAAD